MERGTELFLGLLLGPDTCRNLLRGDLSQGSQGTLSQAMLSMFLAPLGLLLTSTLRGGYSPAHFPVGPAPREPAQSLWEPLLLRALSGFPALPWSRPGLAFSLTWAGHRSLWGPLDPALGWLRPAGQDSLKGQTL